MKCYIRSNNVKLDTEQRRKVVARIETVLARVSDKIKYVVISFRDINGTRGGEDKQCHVKIVGNSDQTVNVKEARRMEFIALEVALEKAQYSFVNQMKRLIKKMRQQRSMQRYRDMQLQADGTI
jgi:putative sigma-54 modulation protein